MIIVMHKCDGTITAALQARGNSNNDNNNNNNNNNNNSQCMI